MLGPPSWIPVNPTLPYVAFKQFEEKQGRPNCYLF